MFDAGPAGYSASFSLEPGAGDGMPSRVYHKAGRGADHRLGADLRHRRSRRAARASRSSRSRATYPDLRRFIREGYVRYAFTRFGVAYVVSIQCLDSVAKPRRLACKEAYPVAERFLKALRIAGGQRMRPLTDMASNIIDRPAERSADFSYRPSGDIIPNTGYRNKAGHPDVMAYAQIRFPLERHLPFIRSQSYGKRDKSEGPTAYPWRDNFCRVRSFEVWQCARRLRAPGRGYPGRRLPTARRGPRALRSQAARRRRRARRHP